MLKIDRLRLVLPARSAGHAARLGRGLADAIARELAAGPPAAPSAFAGGERRLERLDGIRIEGGTGTGDATIARRGAAAVVRRLREEG